MDVSHTDDERLSRIEAKLDLLCALVEKYQPMLQRASRFTPPWKPIHAPKDGGIK